MACNLSAPSDSEFAHRAQTTSVQSATTLQVLAGIADNTRWLLRCADDGCGTEGLSRLRDEAAILLLQANGRVLCEDHLPRVRVDLNQRRVRIDALLNLLRLIRLLTLLQRLPRL